MEREPGTLSHQHSRDADELQAAGLPRKNRWAAAAGAALSMQKEQGLAGTSRSHFPRSAVMLHVIHSCAGR